MQILWRHSVYNKCSLRKHRPRTVYCLIINTSGWSGPVTSLLNLPSSLLQLFFVCAHGGSPPGLCTYAITATVSHLTLLSSPAPQSPLPTGTAPFDKTQHASDTRLSVLSMQMLLPNRRDVISSGSIYCVRLNNKPKMQEDCINSADTAGEKKKKKESVEYMGSFFYYSFFPVTYSH